MENKKNRNKRLAIIAAMLALIVLILCLGGNTFAKYISANTYEAKNVTVAKWGFVLDVKADDMFSDKYNGGDVATEAEVTAGTVDVKAASKTVAPGTSGKMTFNLSGTAEVLSKLTVTATGTDVALVYTPEGGSETTYNPIMWTLKKDNVAVTGAENVTLAAMILKLNALSEESINPGEPATNAGAYELSWTWVLNVDDNTDAKDTALGLYTATKDGDADKVVKTFTTTTTSGEPATTTPVKNTIDTTKTVVNFDFKLEIKVEQMQNS